MFLRSGRVFGFVFYFIIFINEAAPKIQRNQKPAKEFSEYAIVQPSLYQGRTKRAIHSTNNTDGEHHQKVTMELDVDGKTLALDLILNRDLLTRNHVLSYQRDGKTKQHSPASKELDICQYKGEVREKPGSWAALSTCHGVRGLFHDGKNLRYIEPEGTTVKSQHFIYDHSKLVFGNGTRLLRTARNNNEYRYNENYKGTRYNDAPKAPYIGNPRSSYIELVVVVDNGLYRTKRGNLKLIYEEIKDLVNVINSMFAPLNIFVTLVGVKVWSERDEIYISNSALETLDAFLKYRFEKLLFEMPNDHAVFVTAQGFLGGVVGKAYVKGMCTREKSGSVASWHTETLGIMAATIAHEIGHNLAMNHDFDDCECKGDACIMSPTILSTVPILWSNCSLKSLAVGLQKGGNYCLRNMPNRLFGLPNCGNGFVESGEQCDCGMGEGRHRACEACCDPETCLLRSNATCATGSCCDLQTCQIKPVANLCRAAVRECDLPEYCTGKSEYCPDDVYKMDTTLCGRNEAYCMRGKCRSHNSQCRLLWGQSAADGDSLCYNKNNKTSSLTGNCGYDFLKKTYTPCEKKNALCGRLQCRHYTNEIEFGSPVLTGIHLIILKGRTCRCSTALIDTGTDEDLGMVPDGAMCGENKICMDHQCLDVTYVRKRMKIENSVCPSNCSGHGVCNSKGNCHCDAGFAPPMCESPGAGGSVDSGPQSDPDVLKNLMIAMYVIFLGILPLIILLLLLICCLKKRKQDASLVDLIINNRFFSYISKSYQKTRKCNETHNIPKPKLRKEDIEVITDCDETTNLNPDTCVKVEPISIVRPLDLDNSKKKTTKSNVLSSLSHKNNLKPKIKNETVISKYKEAKISCKNTSVESFDISRECIDGTNFKNIRKLFDRTE